MPQKPEPPRPGRVTVTEINLAPTVPPPAPDKRPPPIELAAPRPKLPSVRDTTIAELAEQARKAREEADALRDALAAKQAPAPPTPPAASEKPPTRAQWQTAGFRVVVSLGAVLTALATILGVRTTATIEPKVDRAVDKQVQQDKKAVTVEDRLVAIERYIVALEKHSACVDAERDSALERGTGHVIDGDHANVQWAESVMPVAKPRTLWKNPPWFIAKDEACPPRPAPPRMAP